MKGKRRNHSAQFKVKVALAAIKGDQPTGESDYNEQVMAIFFFSANPLFSRSVR